MFAVPPSGRQRSLLHMTLESRCQPSSMPMALDGQHMICKVCGKSFASSVTLRRHAVVHTGEKPYKCDICDKRFNVQTNLTRHKKLHNTATLT